MKYYLNPKTGIFHIENYCCHAKRSMGYHVFNSAEEVYHAFGQPRPCKICEKKKDEILKQAEKVVQ